MPQEKSVQSQLSGMKSQVASDTEQVSEATDKLIQKLRLKEAVANVPKSAVVLPEQKEKAKDLAAGMEAQARVQKFDDLQQIQDTLSTQGMLSEEVRNLVEKLRTEPERQDLSPFLAVLDRQLGTNMLQTYRRPPTKLEVLTNAVNLHAKLQDTENKQAALMAQLRGINPDETFSQEDRAYYNGLGIRDSELNRIAASPATATYQINKLVMQRTPSEKQLNKIQDLDNALVTLSEINQGFNPEYVGPTKGAAIELLPGVTTKYFQSPAAMAWRSNVGRFFDTYRKAITGAQASLKELKFLQKNVPNISDTPEQFRQKLKAFSIVFNKIRKNTLDKYRNQGKYVDRYITPLAADADDLIEGAKVQEEVKVQKAIDFGFEPIE